MTYEGKRALVVGLGESGKAAARFLVARGALVTLNDSRGEDVLAAVRADLADLSAQWSVGGHPASLFESHDLVVPSPGVPWDLPALEAARAAGVTVAGELELAASELRGRTIAVTGTNGKTTTTALIGHILDGAGLNTVVAGNIGTPVLSIVDGSTDGQWNVLELSSFQLEAMRSFRAHVAVCLNVTPDHLDRHGDFESYLAAKARLFAAQEESDFAVINADSEACLAIEARGQVVRFSRTRDLADGCCVRGGWITRSGGRVAPAELPIRGPHNLENALAAVAATALAGVPDSAIAAGLQSFQAVEHRLEFVRSVGGVDYYNDSKATNVDAAIKAVESFDGGLWLILGGRDKDGDFSALAPSLRGRVRELLLIGEAAEKIDAQLGPEFPVRDYGDLAAALRHARENANPGDTVLLAPACASFDQFENYGQRGREFKRLTEEGV